MKTRGAIAAGHPQTAEAGLEVLHLGGNAFDAAVAAILTSFVAESVLTSAGGSGFLLAHTGDGRNILFDFFSQTPRRRQKAERVHFFPIAADFGDTIQEFHIGPGSMAVPGNIAGVFQVHSRLGRLPFRAVAAPAIACARRGVVVNAFQAFCLKVLEPIMLSTAAARRLYAPEGRLLKAGETLYMPELADTLEWLVAEGPAVFYRGELARRFITDCEQLGAHLRAGDLENYQVIEREPLIYHYRGRRFASNPAPSAGGPLIAFALALLADLDIAALQDTPRYSEVLTQVMRLTDLARAQVPGPPGQMLEPATLEHYRKGLTDQPERWGSTTHISVIDSEGNAASTTTTNGEGSAYVIPGTQIMVNNMLGEDDLHPEGFERWPEDSRIASMMAPSLVLESEKPRLALGSGGSKRIRTAILQVLVNLLDFQMPLVQAVASPRLHWEAGRLHIEPGLEPPPILPDETLLRWREPSFFFGGVHAVEKAGDGTLSGAADPRRGGVVLS